MAGIPGSRFVLERPILLECWDEVVFFKPLDSRWPTRSVVWKNIIKIQNKHKSKHSPFTEKKGANTGASFFLAFIRSIFTLSKMEELLDL